MARQKAWEHLLLERFDDKIDDLEPKQKRSISDEDLNEPLNLAVEQTVHLIGTIVDERREELGRLHYTIELRMETVRPEPSGRRGCYRPNETTEEAYLVLALEEPGESEYATLPETEFPLWASVTLWERTARGGAYVLAASTEQVTRWVETVLDFFEEAARQLRTHERREPPVTQ